MNANDTLAEKFVEFERDFADEAKAGGGNADLSLRTNAGRLVIAAFRRGLLNIDGLAELVEHHTTPGKRPEGAVAWRVRCPANLWSDLIGSHVVHVDGRKVRDVGAGLLQRAYPDAFTLIDQRSDTRGVEVSKRMATACRVLASTVRLARPSYVSRQWLKANSITDSALDAAVRDGKIHRIGKAKSYGYSRANCVKLWSWLADKD